MDERLVGSPAYPRHKRQGTSRSTSTPPTRPAGSHEAVLDVAPAPIDGFIRMLFNAALHRVTVVCRSCGKVVGRMRGKPPSYYPETTDTMAEVGGNIVDHFHDAHPDQWGRLSRIARRWKF